MSQLQDTCLRRLEIAEFSALYARMARDFPRNERPPKAAIRSLIQRGLNDAWIMQTAGQDAAYALCARHEGAVLVTHLAVYAERRGGGVGTRLLELLAAQYADAARLIVEVERVEDAKSEADTATRQKRIAFYERCDYVGYPKLPYKIWRVPMMLMVRPLSGAPLPADAALRADLKALYGFLLPPLFQHMLEI